MNPKRFYYCNVNITGSYPLASFSHFLNIILGEMSLYSSVAVVVLSLWCVCVCVSERPGPAHSWPSLSEHRQQTETPSQQASKTPLCVEWGHGSGPEIECVGVSNEGITGILLSLKSETVL